MSSREPSPTPSITVLVVEDSENIAKLVRMYLEEAGYRVLVAADGAQAIEIQAREHPDLMVLDLMLPKVVGFEVIRQVRQWSEVPVLMLTASDGPDDRVTGLESGADDYLTKPFNPQELVSRVRAILRRTAPRTPAGDEALRFPGLVIFPLSHRVEVEGAPVELTAKEFLVLLTMASAPDQLFTREALLSRVWGFEFLGDSRTVDVHIGTLRRKIERDPAHPRYIKTIWRVGYKFMPTDLDNGEAPV